MINNWQFSENSILHTLNAYRPPKEVFQAFCFELGRYYAQKGFKYAQSRPKLTKKISKNLHLEISFWSSGSNMTGQYVCLNTRISLTYKGLDIFKAENGLNNYPSPYNLNYTGLFSPNHTQENYKFLLTNISQVDEAFFVDFVRQLDKLISFENEKDWIDALIQAEVVVPYATNPDNLACYLAMQGDKRLGYFLLKNKDKIQPEIFAALRSYPMLKVQNFFDFITQNATTSEVENIDSVMYFKCFEDICLKTGEEEIEDLRKKIYGHLCPSTWLVYSKPDKKYAIRAISRVQALAKLQDLLYKGVCLEPPICDTQEDAVYWTKHYELSLQQNSTCRAFFVEQPFDCKPFINHYLLIFVLDYTTEVFLFGGWD